jgi:hypothetical protein
MRVYFLLQASRPQSGVHPSLRQARHHLHHTPPPFPGHTAQHALHVPVQERRSWTPNASSGVDSDVFWRWKGSVPCGTWLVVKARLVTLAREGGAMADLDAELALFQAELGALTDDTPAEAPTQPAVRASFVGGVARGRAVGTGVGRDDVSRSCSAGRCGSSGAQGVIGMWLSSAHPVCAGEVHTAESQGSLSERRFAGGERQPADASVSTLGFRR